MSSDQKPSAPHLDPSQNGERLLARKLFWSKVAIFIENLWLKLLPAFMIIALFIIASLYELWSHLTPLIHRLGLALFLITLIGALFPLFSLRWPKQKQALKRLDNHAVLPHQPAQAFKDQLSPNQATGATRALWLQFKQRLIDKIKQLKVRPPRPNTAQKDPYALRIALLMTIALGLFIQGGDYKNLLLKGITLPPLINTNSLRIDAWVTPPTYTLQAPILIADGMKLKTANKQPEKNNFKIAENSILTIRINGNDADRVELNPGNNPKANKQQGVSTQNKKAIKQKLKLKTSISTREFHIKMKSGGPINLLVDQIPLKSWEFEIIEDQPPVIGLVETPTRAQSGALNLKYRVADDYGVISAKTHLDNLTIEGQLPTDQLSLDERPLGTAPVYPLNLPEFGTKAGKSETFKDLTRHPWAGLTATLTLTATDEGGNTSKSPELRLQIPAYKFTKPLAKEIIELRKALIITPHQSPLVARELYAITKNEDHFKDDLSLYLGLRVASTRMLNAYTRREKEEIAELLYEIARHIEDGDLSKAEKELRAAQDALRKALKENASRSEIQKRINELRKALRNYMQALAKQQQKDQAQNDNQTDPNSQNKDVNSKDFEQMLKTIEELAKSGSKELAQQMLSQMQNMLENLQTGKNQQNQKPSQMAKDLEKLGKLLRQQQQLMDQTFEERRQQNQRNRPQNPLDSDDPNQRSQKQQDQQQSQRSENGQPQSQSLEKQQQALRQQLQDLMREMQQRPGQGQDQGQDQKNQALEKAGKAMGRAGEMLKEQDLSNALSQEGQALDQLRQGMKKMGEQMRQANNGKGKGRGRGKNGRDPLGRPNGQTGLDTSESTKIPDKIDIQRAREILRNLQEKMADPNRPAPELNYYERLLKRF